MPLRKGRLNEQAFSAFLFLRDHAGGDLVDFIDSTLAIAALSTNPITIGREALIAALASIVGVSRKLASMTLASLLIAGAKRPGWENVGRSMVAIDSLVHNFLHRTGILTAYGAEHLYGARCFGAAGCEAVIRDLTERLHASAHGDDRERLCPRYVQHAIWRYCASDELAICNGNNIPAATACELDWCQLWDRCSRLPLRAPSSREEVP